MRYVLLTLILLHTSEISTVSERTYTLRSVCKERPKIVAVIDTGFGNKNLTGSFKLCETGHKDFTDEQVFIKYGKVSVPIDTHGHGTNIAGLISKYGKNSNYCILVLKYYSPTARTNDNIAHTVEAIQYATRLGAKFINYSGGGLEFYEPEAKAVKTFIDSGGVFVAAAGNEGRDLASVPYYPAMDDNRTIVVGNLDGTSRAKTSNYGDRVNIWENGTNQTAFGITLTGTSQSAAIVTGKIASKIKCKNVIQTVSQ